MVHVPGLYFTPTLSCQAPAGNSSGPLCPQFTLLLLCSCVTTGVALSNPFSPHASLTITHS